MKRVICIVVISILCLCVALGGVACKKEEAPQLAAAKTLAEQYATANPDTPTITDYTVAEGFDIGTVRFAFYSPSTGWVEDVATAPFDESKPTVIHSHGQGLDGRMFTPDAMYNEGYNVMSFLWGTLSNDMDVLRIERRLWQRITSYAVSATESKCAIVEAEEGFNCTVPELYLARYCDFFALHPNYNQPIQLSGHSYGGQLIMALSTYMTKLFLEGRLPANLLPERYIMLDPYFDNYNQQFQCGWLGTTIEYSSMGAAMYCMDNYLFPNNVAIEMLRTSDLVELAAIMSFDDEAAPEYFTQIKPRLRVVELANKNELRNQFDNVITGSGFLHTVANDFYFSPNALSLYSDADGVAIFGRANSASLILATQGMQFDLRIDEENYRHYENVTVERHVFEDEWGDPIPQATVVAGIVVRDANGDGKANEKACERLDGVVVTLTDKATGISQTATTKGGAYRFEVKEGGSYTLSFASANYEAKTLDVTASAFVNVADFALAAK